MSHLWQSLKSSISAIRYSDDQYGKAFLIASDTGDLDKMLQHIETRGVSYQDEYGQRPLHRASRRGHTSAVRMLLEYGSDPNLKDHVGAYTALQYAAHYQHSDVVRLLVAYGADPHYCNKIACRSAAFYATMHPHIKQAIQQGISDLYIHRSIAASYLMGELDVALTSSSSLHSHSHSQPLRHSIAMSVVEFIPRHQLWHQRKTRYITDATTNWHSSQLFSEQHLKHKNVIHSCRYHGEFDIDTDWDAIQAHKRQQEEMENGMEDSGRMACASESESESDSAYYETESNSEDERKYNDDTEYHSTSHGDSEYKSLSSDEEESVSYSNALDTMPRRRMSSSTHHMHMHRGQRRKQRHGRRQRQRQRHGQRHGRDDTVYSMNRWLLVLSVLVVVIAVLVVSVGVGENMDVVRKSMYNLYRCLLSILLDHTFIHQ